MGKKLLPGRSAVYYAYGMTTVKKRSFLIWVGGVVIIAVAAAAVWWFVYRPGTAPHVSDDSSARVDNTAAWSERDQKIQEFEAKNDTDGALKYYEQLAQQAPDANSKRSLLFEQSNFTLRVKQYDTALRLMDEAEKIKPGVDVVTQRALIYEAMGDKAKAAAQYSQALEMTKDTNNGQGDRYAPVWRAKVKELQG
jgi:tetratricopeptide (TPR) repeat protein